MFLPWIPDKKKAVKPASSADITKTTTKYGSSLTPSADRLTTAVLLSKFRMLLFTWHIQPLCSLFLVARHLLSTRYIHWYK